MDIETRARELLADQIETVQGYALAAQELRDGVVLDGYSMLPAALSAIRAALTPPEGWVLVPQVLPEQMLDALYCAEGDMSDDEMQELWQQLLAARPEVP